MGLRCESVQAMLERRLQNKSTALPDEARRHLAECPNCRSLYTWMVSETEPVEVPEGVRAEIERRMMGSLRPVKPVGSVHRSFWQLLLLFAMFAVAVLAAMGTAGVENMSRLQLLAIAILLATGVSLLSVSLAWQMRPGSAQCVPALALVAGFGAGLLTGIGLLFPWRAESFIAEGWPCLLTGVGIAFPAAALLWIVLRRGAPVSIPTMGATLGAAAGLLGVTVLQFQCPHQEAPHLLVWHGGVLLVTLLAGAGAGAVIRRALLRP